MPHPPDRPFVVAGLLGGIAGVITGLLGGFHVRPGLDHTKANPSWALDLFGVPVLDGIRHYGAVTGFGLLAFAAVGLVVAVVLTSFVRRRLWPRDAAPAQTPPRQ